MSRLVDDLYVEQLPRPDYLVHGILTVGSLAVLYGPPASAKTFAAIDMALSVATGTAWHGRAVRQGPVVHVYAEGSGGLGARVRAWKEHHNLTGRAGAYFLREPVTLLDPDDVARFIEEIRQLDRNPELVIVDTLARCFGGDENSTADMSRAIAALDKIRHASSAVVLCVHHTDAKGERERGNSALRGAADTMIAVSMNDSEGLVSLRCAKQKDAMPFRPISLRLQPEGESAVLV